MQDSVLGGPLGPARLPTLDPLADARRLLRQAARVPYSAARPQAWATAFRRNAVAARAALARHVRRTQESDAPLPQLDREEPRLHAQIARTVEAHEELLVRTRALVREAEALRRPDVWEMVTMGEKAMLLAEQLERHKSRELAIVYEGHNRDLGGG
ncbi:MAG: hypothetical protein IT304_09500 [Dehalococcoidia bacterium]|nr:hypothetical protein [Dehalococcoidia bacterium]